MRYKQLLGTFVLLFSLSFVYAHKDRIEKPKIYRFIFQGNDTINLSNPNDSLLKVYCDQIINHKKYLIEVQLTFNTKEKLNFNYKNNKLETIRIFNKDVVFIVPKETINKISEINFQTLAFLWDGNYKSAFEANYFYIQFDIGTEKSFDKLPYVQLFFSGKKFSKSIIWRQISENTKQWEDF